MNNEQLNNLVVRYQHERTDDVFDEIYAIVSKNWRNLEAVGRSIYSNGPEMRATYDDMLLACIEVYDQRGDFVNLLNRYIWRKRNDIYKVNKGRRKYEAIITESENADGSKAATYELADELDIEEQVITDLAAKQKADQRQLIDFLVRGENERTTAIVQTFLSTDLKTPTAIGKHLGLDHKQVTRALNRLAGKFSTKQFGDYHDYLVAQ